MYKKSNKKGFSLVELLVVITIIAILSVTAYVALGGQTIKAKNSRRQQDLSTIQSALEIYYIENNNKYPDSLANLKPNYMPKIPTDPSATSTSYKYEHSSNKEYQLAATLETEVSPNYAKAYVIGNGDKLITGVEPINGGACTTPADKKLVDGIATCVPYKL